MYRLAKVGVERGLAERPLYYYLRPKGRGLTVRRGNDMPRGTVHTVDYHNAEGRVTARSISFGEVWSSEDDQTLIEFAKRGQDLSVIQEAFPQDTEDDIQNRMRALNVLDVWAEQTPSDPLVAQTFLHLRTTSHQPVDVISQRAKALVATHRLWLTTDAKVNLDNTIVCWGCRSHDEKQYPDIHHMQRNGALHRWRYRGYTNDYYESIWREIKARPQESLSRYVLLCRWCHNVIHEENITICQATFRFGALAAAVTSDDCKRELQKLNQSTRTPSRRGRKRTTKS